MIKSTSNPSNWSGNIAALLPTYPDTTWLWNDNTRQSITRYGNNYGKVQLGIVNPWQKYCFDFLFISNSRFRFSKQNFYETHTKGSHTYTFYYQVWRRIVNMAENSSTAVPPIKSVIELLEEDDEFEVSFIMTPNKFQTINNLYFLFINCNAIWLIYTSMCIISINSKLFFTSFTFSTGIW